MNVYFVMSAPFQSGDVRAMSYDKKMPVEGFFEAEDADDYAKQLARRYPGNQFWVVEGNATKAFITEPLPVRECAAETCKMTSCDEDGL